jgi:hypothetical protein
MKLFHVCQNAQANFFEDNLATGSMLEATT